MLQRYPFGRSKIVYSYAILCTEMLAALAFSLISLSLFSLSPATASPLSIVVIVKLQLTQKLKTVVSVQSGMNTRARSRLHIRHFFVVIPLKVQCVAQFRTLQLCRALFLRLFYTPSKWERISLKQLYLHVLLHKYFIKWCTFAL